MKTLEELEERLSRPNKGLLKDMKSIDGDILLLGVAGKMGPSLARLAKRTCLEAGINKRIIGVSRFSNETARKELEDSGIETLAGDLLDESFLQNLPKCKNVIYLAGRKFGTSGNAHYTWAMNTYLPGRVAAIFSQSRIVAFSTGNVYPLVPVNEGGATENTPPDPLGEYAQSCLGRERMFEYFSDLQSTPVLIFRLNYALDLRYGILKEIAKMVLQEQPIDLKMGYVNVIWQGDANAYALRCLLHCHSPANILNVTGPETISVEWLANEFGKRLGKTPVFINESAPNALLNNASKAHRLFGPPEVTLSDMMDWTVSWILDNGFEVNKPTHFQEREGRF